MFKCPCEPTVETLAQAENDDEAGHGESAQARWWVRLFSSPCQPLDLERIMATQGAGQAWQDGIGQWGSGPGGNTPLSHRPSALDLGLDLDLDLDLGFLFPLRPL